jgi:hypothetical protein
MRSCVACHQTYRLVEDVLGYDDARIAALASAGVIRLAQP